MFAPNARGRKAARLAELRVRVRLRQYYTRRRDHHISRAIRVTGLTSVDFGTMFSRLRRKYQAGKMTERELIMFTSVAGICDALGVPIEMAKYRRIKAISRMETPGQDIDAKFLLWQAQVTQLKADIVKKQTRFVNKPRAEREVEGNKVSVNSDGPPSLIVVKHQAARYSPNIRVEDTLRLGPDLARLMRQIPNGQLGETRIPFNGRERA